MLKRLIIGGAAIVLVRAALARRMSMCLDQSHRRAAGPRFSGPKGDRHHATPEHAGNPFRLGPRPVSV
jgi:hypothetical protein